MNFLKQLAPTIALFALGVIGLGAAQGFMFEAIASTLALLALVVIVFGFIHLVRHVRNILALTLLAIGLPIVWAYGCYPARSGESPGRPSPIPPLAAVPAPEISLDRNFYIVLDGSGSMGEGGCAGQFRARVDAAKWAVREFVGQSVPDDVNLGLYAFDSSGERERVPLGKANRPRILQEITHIQAGGRTPLNAAIETGIQALDLQRARQLGYGEFYVVVATDGEATDGTDAQEGVRFAQQHNIPIVTIGFCLSRDHPLSRDSLSYRNANDPEQLLAALKETQGESSYFDSAVFQPR